MKNKFREYLDVNRGAITRIAKEMNVLPSAVHQWGAKQVPAERVAKLAKLTRLNKSALRPDLFGRQ